jgi:hypothetical protein
MFSQKRAAATALPALSTIGFCLCLWGQPAAAPKTCAEMEEFLREAHIGTQKTTSKGVTQPKSAPLDHNGFKHEGGIQPVHISKSEYKTDRGVELNFKDWWEFNVAGYELAKLLEVNMVPPYIARKVGGNAASLTWYVNDVMLELDRRKKKMEPPDQDNWNKQMYVIRVFNQLIYNVDDNLTNFLIDKNWQLWMIDFTRSFRLHKTLKNPENLVQCDRKLLANLRKLDKATLEEKLVKPRYLSKPEMEAVLARRDKIVEFFEKQIAQKGEAAVLFDLPRVGQPCGVGL